MPHAATRREPSSFILKGWGASPDKEEHHDAQHSDWISRRGDCHGRLDSERVGHSRRLWRRWLCSTRLSRRRLWSARLRRPLHGRPCLHGNSCLRVPRQSIRLPSPLLQGAICLPPSLLQGAICLPPSLLQGAVCLPPSLLQGAVCLPP